jgi:hypothetical protein
LEAGGETKQERIKKEQNRGGSEKTERKKRKKQKREK